MGGFGGLLDISDYNGSQSGSVNIFIDPSNVGNTGIQDLMSVFYSRTQIPTNESWYLVRQTDFKDWSGVAGVFWKTTDFVMEIDIKTTVPTHGGYRDEAPNGSAPILDLAGNPNLQTPYLGAAQGAGVCLRAIIVDPITHLEVVKDTQFLQGAVGNDLILNPLLFPRQIVKLNLSSVTPDEMLTMVLRITTQQYSGSMFSTVVPTLYPHTDMDTTIFRVGLTANVTSLHSSGKQSAAMTSR